MAVYRWSTLANGQVINPFDRLVDVLRFDGGISAASVVVAAGETGRTTSFSFGGKTVTLQIPIFATTTSNVTFSNGSRLVIGDDAGETAYDNSGGDITGGTGADQLIAGAGGYSLSGLGGNDLMLGAAGDDRLDGSTGADTMRGGAGNDTYFVNSSLDVIREFVSQGTDEVFSRINYTLTAHVEILHLGSTAVRGIGNAQANEIYGGGLTNTTLSGLAGNDYLEAGSGSDTLIGGTGADVLEGGTGVDFASYVDATSRVTVDLSGDIVFFGEAVGDEFGSIEGLLGSAFSDRLYGNDVGNTLQGLAGNDTLVGALGNDTLSGGAGNDSLDGMEGSDSLAGGAGNDTFYFETDESNGDVVLDFEGNGALTADRLIFSGFGTLAEGARFIQLDATRWQITSGGEGLLREVITFSNAAAIHPADYTFI